MGIDSTIYFSIFLSVVLLVFTVRLGISLYQAS